MPPLSTRQQQLFDYAEQYIAQHGEKPMYKEIGSELGICIQRVYEHLAAIEDKGWILTRYGWLRIPDEMMKRKREMA